MRFDKSFLIIILLIVFSGAAYLLLYTDFYPGIITFTVVSLFNSILYLILSKILLKTCNSKLLITLIIGAGIIFRGSLLFLPPTASDDIYRYIWDGKVQAHGINPYKYPPSSPELDSLHSEMLPQKVNFPNMKSIYPPFAQYVFLGSYLVWGDNPAGFKFILLLFETATILLIYYSLKRLKSPGIFSAFYALCPLPIMQFSIDGHVDAIGICMMMLGIYLFLSNKKAMSYAAMGLSIASKIISAMIIPFLHPQRKIKSAIISLAVSFAFFLLTYIPYLNSSVNPFESLAAFTAHWVFNGSIFSVILGITGHNQRARIICGILLIISALLIFFSKKEPREKIYYMVLSFLLLSPTVHPWYVCWLAVLLPFSVKWSGLIYVSLVNLANYVVIGYALSGIWVMPDFILWLEYIPVFVFLAFELIKNKKWESRMSRTFP